MRLLVVEDKSAIRRLLQRALMEQGYAVDTAETAEAGQLLAVRSEYDCIILDSMLPDQSGVTLCRTLRRRGMKTPVLMLTVLDSTPDKVRALDAGVDDYLVKPFDLPELLARIRSLLRRASSGESTVIRYEDVEMDLLRRTVTRAGVPIDLRPKEFVILEYFLRNPGRVLTRTGLSEHIWGVNLDYGSNIIEVYISKLRHKLGPPRLIHTVPSVGYRLDPPTENVD